MAKNTVPDTILTCTLSQAPFFWDHSTRQRLVTLRYRTKLLSVVPFASSRFFSGYHAFLPRAPEGGRRWSMLLPPSQPKLAPRLPAENLGAFSSRMPLNSWVPIQISWPASHLELPLWVRGISSFWRKDEAKRFPGASSPIPQTHPMFPRWRVV